MNSNGYKFIIYKRGFKFAFPILFVVFSAPMANSAQDCADLLSLNSTSLTASSESKKTDSYLLATDHEMKRRSLYLNTLQSRSPKRVSLKKLDPSAIDTFEDLKPEVMGLIEEGLKPMLGVMVRTIDHQMVLAVGSYFGGSHQSILKELSRKFRLQTILWSGELLVTQKSSTLQIHVANETSDFISEYMKFVDQGSRLGNSRFLFDFLRGVKVGQNSTKWLKAFLKNKNVLFAPGYKAVSFSFDNEHLLPLENENILNFSHEFKNQLTLLMNGFDQVVHGLPSSMDLFQMKILIHQLQMSAKYFLNLSYNLEDEVLIKKIKLFLSMSQVFIDEVHDLDSLGLQDIKDYQDLILTITRLASIQRPNPIVHQFTKFVK